MSASATPAPTVLVVEDSAPTQELLVTVLRRGGYDVMRAADGLEGIRLFDGRRPDVVLLDLHLPGLVTGWKVLEHIRAWSQRPILVLSGMADEQTKVRALMHGADDYVVKPASAAELLARVAALVRRARRVPGVVDSSTYDDGVLQVDLVGRSAVAAGRPLTLTPLEFRLLAAFVRHPGQILSREELLEQAWGDFSGGPSEHVKLYIGYLRRKLAAVVEGESIETVRGFGYRWKRVPEAAVPGWAATG